MSSIKTGEVAFAHKQASHCETGVVSSLLTHQGVNISEPMAFGLASALTFAYLPFVKVSGMPLIAYRMPPKTILKKVSARLNIPLHTRTFKNVAQGMTALDEALQAGRAVGLQTSVYWLPYFPEDMRFHFNAHNLVVYGKDPRGNYLISDPVFETPQVCEPESLARARFAKGALAPKGLMYHFDAPEHPVELASLIYPSIKRTARMMYGIPVPGLRYFGIKGIENLAKQLKSLQSKSPRYARLFLGHIVRMQEEIGTGGAGFRFMYASFLDEASQMLNDEQLYQWSQQVTEIGDQWRVFAGKAVHYCKDRKSTTLEQVSEQLLACASLERQLQKRILANV